MGIIDFLISATENKSHLRKSKVSNRTGSGRSFATPRTKTQPRYTAEYRNSDNPGSNDNYSSSGVLTITDHKYKKTFTRNGNVDSSGVFKCKVDNYLWSFDVDSKRFKPVNPSN